MSTTAVTDAEFSGRVLHAAEPVLVDVWAAWCTPCVTLKPTIERLAERYRGRLTVLTLDADANLDTVTRYQVRALPTVLLFDGGVLVERQVGAQTFETYAALLDRHFARGADGRLPEPGAAAADAGAPIADGSGPEAAEVRALAASAAPLVIFKHSATCIISQTVKQHYDAFVAAHPTVPTRLVIVQQERPLSNAIEDVLRVQHESPQALVVQHGRVLWHASHRRITADALAQAVRL